MKIAFVGKGGSGKTTVSMLLSQYLGEKGFPTLVIDADINQHLGVMLGFSDEEVEAVPQLGLEISLVKEHLRGSNQRIGSATEMIKTTPPGTGSRLLSVSEDNELYQYFSHSKNGVRFLRVGAFTEDDLGVRCYHSKTGAVELILNHLIDHKNEYVIVDMTAGADAFASGLFTRFDVTFLVVEPTRKSISVYTQYKQYAAEYGVHIRVIGNKIESPEDEAYLKEAIGDDLVATLSASPFVKAVDRGVVKANMALETKNIEALATIQSHVDAQAKDWDKFYAQALIFHTKNAESWGNDAVGKNLLEQIDPNFSLARYVENM